MQRPVIEIDHRTIPQTVKSCRRLLAYLLRATRLRMRFETIGEERFRSLATELEGCLIPLVVSERSALAFYRALCGRFSVDASGDANDTVSEFSCFPVEAWLPEGRIRWDRALAAMNYHHLRLVVQENPALLATFATTPVADGEDAIFDSFDDPTPGAQYRPQLPQHLIPSRTYRTVWTLMSPLAHGADQKTGNVTLFRRHRMVDVRTGEHCYVPFVSGNAVRGIWRDMVMGRYLSLLGLRSTDVPPARIHALLSGGNVAKGAETGAVNLGVRTQAREMCPPWDLLAGCVDQQIMAGRARVHDATLVCRETAWMVRPLLAPDMEMEEFAASLPEAAECTTLRLGTRHAHRDLAGSDGAQMIFNIEHIVPGKQLVHSFQIWGVDGVSPVTQACLTDLLSDFAAIGVVGAQAARGSGLIAFDSYQPGTGASALPSPDVYLEYVEKNREAMIDWVMRRDEPIPARNTARKRRGAQAKGTENAIELEGSDERAL